MITVKCSPHIHSKNSTDKAMIYVIIALLPSCIWGCFVFGWHAAVVVAVSIISAVLSEYLLNLISKEHTLTDFSALLTGLLVGMNMPPMIPLYVPVIASVFAIAVVKWTFGGLGSNWMNPALGGRVFVFFSFTNAMTDFTLPKTLMKAADAMSRASFSNHIVADAFSGATPLSVLKTGLSMGITGHDQFYMLNGRPVTDFASSLGDKLGINPFAVDAFFGNTPGCIGEVSALLLILGGIFLLCMKVINWRIPVIYIGSFTLLTWIFGGLPYELGLFSGEILLPVFSGGLMLGAIFMATDWVTTPTTPKGEIIYAIGCGFFTFLLRSFGSLPEGVSLAIILMNIAVPTIDRYCKTKKFGFVKVKKEKRSKGIKEVKA